MRWLGLALLGILIAAAVSIAASRLASQQIGLASQPISAGDALAPTASREMPKHRHPSHQTRTSTEPTPPSPPPTSSEPPTYAPPPSTTPASPATPPSESSHDGEHSGNAGGGADD
jgi:hypothetical protein